MRGPGGDLLESFSFLLYSGVGARREGGEARKGRKGERERGDENRCGWNLMSIQQYYSAWQIAEMYLDGQN